MLAVPVDLGLFDAAVAWRAVVGSLAGGERADLVRRWYHRANH